MRISRRTFKVFSALLLVLLLMVFSYAYFAPPINNIEILSYKDTIKTIASTDEMLIICVSRDTCAACQELKPQLMRISRKHQTIIRIYDSTQDYNTKDKNYGKFIEKYSIVSIPTILVIQNSEALTSFDGHNIISDFESYLENLND